MKPIFKFMLFFAVSLVAIFFFLDFVGNPFIQSFVIALVIAFMGSVNG